MKYCADTSSLMDAWCRWYPPELFPTLWQNLDKLIAKEALVSSEEVCRELEKKTDDLAQWAKERQGLFLPLSTEVQEEVTRILAKFPRLVDARTGKSYADPFVIATAKTTGTILVTGEKPTGSRERPKIPDVCQELEIACIDIVEMIRSENWQF